jgi:tRNA (mo5U34)-methyltransferase
MLDFSLLTPQLDQAGLGAWAKPLENLVTKKLDIGSHGDLTRWYQSLDQLPKIQPNILKLDSDTIQIGCRQDINHVDIESFTTLLKQFHPWRKGPFNLFGVNIDTEWRSDWKWNRLKDAIAPLAGRTVLDVGCGNGYHVLRAAGSGAKLVVGIDPTLIFNMQFQVLQRYAKQDHCWVLPVTLEELPNAINSFDTIFSMGVLYHRRSPIDHLIDLKQLLRPGGELVIETLIVDGDAQKLLIPPGRYAKMRNVWFIPSETTLEVMLKRSGFRKIRKVDTSITTSNEQRSTEWMTYESLADFLDPENASRTIEGLPAPKRAIYIASV